MVSWQLCPPLPTNATLLTQGCQLWETSHNQPYMKKFIHSRATQLIVVLIFITVTACASNVQVAPTEIPNTPTSEPTNTPIPEPTETNTSVPPTVTPEPTATNTPMPTETSVPVVEYEAQAESADCAFTQPAGFDISCGYLTVPEDRANPDGNSVRIHYAIFASENVNPESDPIVYLEGGPGGHALDTAQYSFADRFSPYLVNRDVILFDQRGTGNSSPSLACDETTQLGYEMLDDDVTTEEAATLTFDALNACRQRLAESGVNLEFYNSKSNAADVDDLRQALGYEQWNLLGISYGTRLAQTIMRDFPDGVRSVMLDSSYPLESDLFREIPDNTNDVLNTLFAGCKTDALCDEAYPDLETVFYDLVATVDANPIMVEAVPHFLNGDEYDVLIEGASIVAMVFQSLYSTDIIPLIPQMLYDTQAGNYTILRLLLANSIINDEFSSTGFYFSVQCNEEISFGDEAAQVAEALEYPRLQEFFGVTEELGDPIFDLCEMWASGEADAVENEPVTSDIPTLVLAGQYDPITPPKWGEQIANHLTNAQFVTFPGLGHGVNADDPCALAISMAFFDAPESAVNSACVADMTSPQFNVPVTSAETIELEPFSDTDLGISGMRPVGWEEIGLGTYARASSAIDQTALIIQSGPIDAEQMLELLAQNFGFDPLPESSGDYTTETLTWTRYQADLQGFPLDFAISSKEGLSTFVLLISEASEQETLQQAVFYPVLDALVVE